DNEGYRGARRGSSKAERGHGCTGGDHCSNPVVRLERRDGILLHSVHRRVEPRAFFLFTSGILLDGG
ncbi:unnamed protein product, partial [Ectocarpus sp. 12 AP-2014]